MNLWNNQSAVNLYTVLHFCFGLLVASVSYIKGVGLAFGLFAASVSAVIWEIYERFKGENESWLNSLFDILSTVVAFCLAFYLIKYLQNYSYVPYVLITVSAIAYLLFFAKGKL